MNPEQAVAFAARITDKIKRRVGPGVHHTVFDADREHVAAFLRAFERAEEGLRDHLCDHLCGSWDYCWPEDGLCPDARRYTEVRAEAWDGLVRTGAIYGVKP